MSNLSNWRSLIHTTDLRPAQIRKIPGASSESLVHLVQYGVHVLGIPLEELFDGVNIDLDHLNQADTWVDPVDNVRLLQNFLLYSPSFITPHDLREIGKRFRFAETSSLGALFNLVPVHWPYQEIHKCFGRFSNYCSAIALETSSTKALLAFEFYPYYKSIAEGLSPFYLEGMLLSNFGIHGVTHFEFQSLTIGFPLKDIVTRAYERFSWSYEERGSEVWLNGSLIGRQIPLYSWSYGANQVYLPQNSGSHGQVMGIEIVEDFSWEGRVVFCKGEVYNAPASVIRLKWRRGMFRRRLPEVLFRFALINRIVNELDLGIGRANERYFEATEALRSHNHQSTILQVYTKKILSEQALKGEDPTKWIPRRRAVAVLFCDIRGFTNISERLNAEEVVSFLNDFFGRMNGLITKHGGEIDKLMGDSVMAQFPKPDSAIDAAIDMNRELQAMNRERFVRELLRVDIGIGITWGEVIQGNIGTSDRLDYTIVGDTVNVASRLESLTRHYQVQCIVSEDLLKGVQKPVKTRFLDRVQVKGKSHAVSIYEMFESDPAWVQEIKSTTQPLYDLAYKVYETGDFTRAVSLYAKIYKEIGPHSLETALSADPVVLFYMDRARELRDAVESGEIDPSRWSGVYKFSTG
ncbi:MAG: adenylate/guanylate cyclase domain-containing protein [Spirochaetales bacterium]|nr:adenylate/guanylate cyclase domain-containing protein [Spirochaetales bacterium]